MKETKPEIGYNAGRWDWLGQQAVALPNHPGGFYP